MDTGRMLAIDSGLQFSLHTVYMNNATDDYWKSDKTINYEY